MMGGMFGNGPRGRGGRSQRGGPMPPMPYMYNNGGFGEDYYYDGMGYDGFNGNFDYPYGGYGGGMPMYRGGRGMMRNNMRGG